MYLQSPLVQNNYLKLDGCIKQLDNCIRLKQKDAEKTFQSTVLKLDALSPLKTLLRGYSYTTNENNKAVNFVNDVKKGEKIHVRVVDGTFDAIVD